MPANWKIFAGGAMVITLFLIFSHGVSAQTLGWVKESTNAAPFAEFLHEMVYDAARQEVILFGGVYNPSFNLFPLLDHTVAWNGTTWVSKTPSVSPPPRIEHGMAYDGARQEVILFGGGTAPGLFINRTPLNDTWIWDGATWQQKFPSNSPTPRSNFGMAYDAERNETILFGGQDPAPTLTCCLQDDTWAWNGTDWFQKSPTLSPSRRSHHQMVYDSARKQIILFGGIDASGQLLNDIWVWDGTNWELKSSTTSPSLRTNFAMTFDESLQKVVLYGGQGTAGSLDDTWVWDGNDWAQLSVSSKPPPQRLHDMVYDASRKEIVMYGGDGALRETWTLPTGSQKRPVILIPGILGSWEKDGELALDPILHTYDNLWEALKLAGYEEDKDLFAFPYNWRSSNNLTSLSLKQKIEDVKNICQCLKVDIVGHSMGGLLARSYI
ncbi:hypothetical protein C4553_03545 [Candidatus Parcubacteria bacterium]|nr:MAG: hypothetical protein C4553_03545 [Candidatus Parcubacteria bacterium]